MIEPALAKEPILRKLAKEPIDPMDRVDPTEPIESTELREPMLRIEFVEPMLQRELSLATASSLRGFRALLAQGLLQVARVGMDDEDDRSAQGEGAREREQVGKRLGIDDREARADAQALP